MLYAQYLGVYIFVSHNQLRYSAQSIGDEPKYLDGYFMNKLYLIVLLITFVACSDTDPVIIDSQYIDGLLRSNLTLGQDVVEVKSFLKSQGFDLTFVNICTEIEESIFTECEQGWFKSFIFDLPSNSKELGRGEAKTTIKLTKDLKLISFFTVLGYENDNFKMVMPKLK